MALINTIVLDATTQDQIDQGDTWITGNTAEARQIMRLENLPIDYLLTNMVVQATSLDGGTGFVRVYQLGRESEAAYIEIPTARVLPYVAQNINLVVQDTVGERTIIVDAFDPSNGAHNTVSMGGQVFLYAKPYVAGM